MAGPDGRMYDSVHMRGNEIKRNGSSSRRRRLRAAAAAAAVVVVVASAQQRQQQSSSSSPPRSSGSSSRRRRRRRWTLIKRKEKVKDNSPLEVQYCIASMGTPSFVPDTIRSVAFRIL
jgi:hypothetical protein